MNVFTRLAILMLCIGCWMDDSAYVERRDAFLDLDGDGVTPNDGDCDDDSPMIHPSADEICDDVDNNCDGLIDEEPVSGEQWYVDLDGDGCLNDLITTCDTPSQPAVSEPEDCD